MSCRRSFRAASSRRQYSSELQPERPGPEGEVLRQRLPGRRQPLAGGEDRVSRRGAPLLDGRAQRARRELLDAGAPGSMCLGRPQEGVDLLQPGREGSRRVLRAVQRRLTAKQRPDRHPVRLPGLTRLAVAGRVERFGLRPDSGGRGWTDGERRPPQVRPDGLDESLRCPPLPQQVPDQEPRTLVEGLPPEVVHHLLQDLAFVRNQLDLERLGAFEGALPQHPLAEAVDGEDRRLVEALHRLGEPAGGCGRLGVPGQQAGQDIVPRICRHPTEERLACRLQPGADPVAQLRGGGHREGDDQDLVHRPPALQYQPEEEIRQGVSLPRPGTGFDEAQAFQGLRQEVQRPRPGAHGRRCSSMGRKHPARQPLEVGVQWVAVPEDEAMVGLLSFRSLLREYVSDPHRARGRERPLRALALVHALGVGEARLREEMQGPREADPIDLGQRGETGQRVVHRSQQDLLVLAEPAALGDHPRRPQAVQEQVPQPERNPVLGLGRGQPVLQEALGTHARQPAGQLDGAEVTVHRNRVQALDGSARVEAPGEGLDPLGLPGEAHLSHVPLRQPPAGAGDFPATLHRAAREPEVEQLLPEGVGCQAVQDERLAALQQPLLLLQVDPQPFADQILGRLLEEANEAGQIRRAPLVRRLGQGAIEERLRFAARSPPPAGLAVLFRVAEEPRVGLAAPEVARAERVQRVAGEQPIADGCFPVPRANPRSTYSKSSLTRTEGGSGALSRLLCPTKLRYRTRRAETMASRNR